MAKLETYWPKGRKENDEWGRRLSNMIWPGKGRIINNCQCMVVHKEMEIRAIFAFHEWDTDAGVIQMSGASEGPWASRGIYRELFGYPFDHLGCQLILNRNDPDNESLINILRRLGYKSYYIPRLRGRDKGDVVMTLTSEDWAKHRINKEVQKDGHFQQG